MGKDQKNAVAGKAKQLQEKVQPHFTIGKGLAVVGVGVVLYSLSGVEPARQVSDTKDSQIISGTQAVNKELPKTGQPKSRDITGLPQTAKTAILPSGLTPPKQTANIIDGQKPQAQAGSVAKDNAVATAKNKLVPLKPSKIEQPQKAAGVTAHVPVGIKQERGTVLQELKKWSAQPESKQSAEAENAGAREQDSVGNGAPLKPNKTEKPQKAAGVTAHVPAGTKQERGTVLQELKKWAAQPEPKQSAEARNAGTGEQDSVGNGAATLAGKLAAKEDEDDFTAEPKIADAPTGFSATDKAGTMSSDKSANKAAQDVKTSEKLPQEKAVTGLADANEDSAGQDKAKKKSPTGLLSAPLPKEAEKQLVTALEKKAKKRKATGLLSAPLALEKAGATISSKLKKQASKPNNAKPEDAGKAALAKGKDTMSKAAALASAVKAGGSKSVVSKSNVSEFTLANGMDVIVIPDHRAPVVTHMVWYKMGAADELPGVSGIAHFLEHLMFKGTDKIKSGEFSKIIARNGGQDNAFTSQDAVAYHQRVAKDRLRLVMEMEADRMRNLKLTEKDIKTERDVILEERRSRTDNDPRAQFREQMDSALYMNHPYGIPVIGWYDEMKKLSREDALRFYRRYYAPNNAILVVAGDVTPQEVEKLAKEIYGVIKPVEGIERSERPKEPPHRAARRIKMYDKRVAKASWQRSYLAAGYNDAEPGEAEALDLLLKIMASGTTGRIYKSMVIKDKIASSAGGGYSGSALDGGKISFSAIGTKGVSLDKLEEAIDKEIALIKEKGVTQQELDRARNSYTADYVYANDNQVSLARRYGWAKVVGRTIAQVESWPAMLGKVSIEDIQKVARKYLVIEKSVTGELLPEKKVASKK